MPCCDCPRDGGEPSIPCRAVHHLWCAYHDWAGHAAAELCAHFGISISRALNLSPFEARLMRDKNSRTGVAIFLPKQAASDASAREELLMYHELAHLVLIGKEPVIRHSGIWQLDQLHLAEEVWCDNFALAMLLARHGWKSFGLTRPGHAFLRYGERVTGKARVNFLLAYRLRREMRKPRKKGSLSKQPLYLLANALLLNAEPTKGVIGVFL